MSHAILLGRMSGSPLEALVRKEVGTMLIALVFAAMLGGFTIVQALTFLRTNKCDPFQHKLVVYFLLFLDIFHLIFFAHTVYHYLVLSPGDISLVWSLPTLMFVETILAPITQTLYIARIWKLTPWSRIYIPIMLTLMILANLVIGIFICCLLSKSRTFIGAIPLIASRVTAANFALRACSDVLIAGSMIFLLAQAKTNQNWTDSSLTMLLAYFLNTGMIASFLSIAVFVVILAMPQSLIFLALEEVTIKLYVNSFMGMLNARHYLQSHHHGPTKTFFLQSETSSHIDPKDRMQRHAPAETINEVGLPLFKLNSTKSKTDNDIRMEIMVKQEANQNTD